MINLYQKLGLMPDATEEQIKRAMQQAVEQDRITLDELNKCKIFLLNAGNREKYTQKLIEAHPELVDSLLDKMAEQMPQAKVNKKPDTKPSNGKVVIKKKENQDKQKQPFNNTGMHPVFLVLLIIIVTLVMYSCIYPAGESEEDSKTKEAVIEDKPVKQTDPKVDAENQAKADNVIANGENTIIHSISNREVSYHILNRSEMSSGVFDVITKQQFQSGTVSYARRQVDCNSRMEKYLGFGDELKDVFNPKDYEQLTTPNEGSSAWGTVQQVCDDYDASRTGNQAY